MEDLEFDPNGNIALIMTGTDASLGGCIATETETENTSDSELSTRRFRFLELPLPDDDPTAFAVLLNIVHGRTRKVPRKITADLLAGIAILVDKYQLHEVTEAFSDKWIECLEPEVPKTLTDNLMVWLSIFWVFGCADQFKRTTKILCTESDGMISAECLPISPAILSAMNDMRQEAISTAISVVGNLISDYQGPLPQCYTEGYGFECDAMVLGALIKGSVGVGIWPLAPSPGIDTSFHGLSGKILSMNIPTLCGFSRRQNGYRYDDDDDDDDYYDGRKGCCNVKATIEASLRSIESKFDGLDIDVFRQL